MFEAIHGSAPRRAGQNVANPSGLLLSAVLMLLHIHQPEVAASVHNAFLKTLEDGIHTGDIFKEGISRQKVGTKEFGEAIAKRLGQNPSNLQAVSYESVQKETWIHHGSTPVTTNRELVGVDVYLYSHDATDILREKLQTLHSPPLKLTMITNRGVKVWPNGILESQCVDLWRCRFEAGGTVKYQRIAALLHQLADAGCDITQTESLYTYDGKPGFSDTA
jgi:isocitrate dehydrogenase